ncbi:hypothetical protein BJ165DRAFT_1408884 [Panaeolus papilionaceus]|nr:hypothetical protein BJ165DRAFT_1408884 [Panaeolus papilionaceus]
MADWCINSDLEGQIKGSRKTKVVDDGRCLKFRDVLLGEIRKGGGEVQVDALSYLSKITFDIIGLAGFNYNSNALDPEAEDNITIALHNGKHADVIPMLRTVFQFSDGRIDVACLG